MRILRILLLGATTLTGCTSPRQETAVQDHRSRSKGSLSETYKDVTQIQIRTVSGDCRVRAVQSEDVRVTIRYDIIPAGVFEQQQEYSRTNGVLVLNERWQEQMEEGSVQWTLEIPKGVPVFFSSERGDFEADGLAGTLRATTLAGEVRVENLSGQAVLQTASGDIYVKACRGEVSANTDSGTVYRTASGKGT